MIAGRFGENGELWFEIELIAHNGEKFPIEGLLNTGFTTGWLAINSHDLAVLEWSLIATQLEMQTARGVELFTLYQGTVIIDGQTFKSPVHAGENIPEILLGSQWLEIMELVVNKHQGILTLKIVNE